MLIYGEFTTIHVLPFPLSTNVDRLSFETAVVNIRPAQKSRTLSRSIPRAVRARIKAICTITATRQSSLRSGERIPAHSFYDRLFSATPSSPESRVEALRERHTSTRTLSPTSTNSKPASGTVTPSRCVIPRLVITRLATAP
jgi:hypothetical protein